MLVRELTQRRYARTIVIRGPDDIGALPACRKLKRAKREHFVVVLLNARHEVEAVETVSIGSLNASIVHPREVFTAAIRASAASIVLVHNHPSGDPAPSRADIALTRDIADAGKKLGIAVHDHIIIGANGHSSMRGLGLL